MEIFLIRHGQTAGNLERRYIGRTNEPLCEAGVRAAEQSGVSPEIRHVYVSPMRRALETARVKFPNAELTVCPDLREMDFGDFEGRSADEMAVDPDYIRWVEGGCAAPCPNGEDSGGFTARTVSAFCRAADDCAARREDRLIIVAHGGSVMAVMSSFAVPSRPYFEWHVDNCCGYRAQLEESEPDGARALRDWERFSFLQL